MALALVTSGCSSLGDDAPDIERDQRVAEGTSTGDTPAKGPGPGVLTEAWRVTGPDLPPDDPNPDLRVAGGQLLFGTSRRIDTYDARTGRKRWHYAEPGRVLSHAVAGDAVVVDSRAKGEEPAPVTTGLDLSTGEVLWEQAFGTEETSPEILTDRAGNLATADGVIPLFAEGAEDRDPGELIALDSATGEEKWRREHAFALGCDDPETDSVSDTDGSVLVFIEECTTENDAALHAFDPATGRPLWSRSGDTEDLDVSVRRGTTLIVLDENTRALVGRDGKDRADLRRLDACAFDCSLIEAGDGLAVRAGGATRHTVSLIGKGGARPVLEADDETLAVTGGGRVYSLHLRHGEALLPPAGLVMTDPRTGRTSAVPMPFRIQPGTKFPPWLGTAGDLLLLRQDRRVTAYRSTPASGPVELGGVPEKDWPKACPLLDGVEKVKKHREDTEPVEVGGTTVDLPRCTISYEGSDFTREARAWVSWVAPDAKRAAPFLAGEPVEGADAVRQEGIPEVTYVRTGRYIVAFEAPDEDREEIVASVVKGLK